MEPHAFVKEVYRRMALRHAASQPPVSWAEMEKQSQVLQAVHELRDLLPQDKNAAILDIGFGRGWFLAACLKLGYRELSGADFGIAHKDYIRTWSERPIQLYEIEDNIGDFLSDRAGQYDFIHLSHVIEHIPKYSLLWVVDALYRALKPGGVLMLRTPTWKDRARTPACTSRSPMSTDSAAQTWSRCWIFAASTMSAFSGRRPFSPHSSREEVPCCGASS